jgi:hypothetical protein
MRLAFVLRLGNDTRPADGFFEGWVEEVDSCTELRFRSTDELLKFLGHRFDLSTAPSQQGEATGCKQTAVQKAKRIARAARRKRNLGSDL